MVKAWIFLIAGLSTACQSEPVTTRSAEPPQARAGLASAKPTPSAGAPSFAPGRSLPGRSLPDLIAVTLDPQTTIETISDIFGPHRDDTVLSSPRSYEIVAPVPGAARVVIRTQQNQNRELLSRVSVQFRAGVEPTVAALAARLDIPLATSTMRIQYGCTHGGCPFVPLQRDVPLQSDAPGDKERLRMRFGLVHEPSEFLAQVQGRDDIHSGQATNLRVEKLEYDILDVTCPVGRRSPHLVKLRPPSSERQERLARSLHKAAEALARPDADAAHVKPRVKRALGIRGDGVEVRFRHNAEHAHTEVKLIWLGSDQPVAIFTVPGFRYVTDPSLLCRVWASGNHLFELPTESDAYRVFLTISTPAADHREITSITLERGPRAHDWYFGM